MTEPLEDDPQIHSRDNVPGLLLPKPNSQLEKWFGLTNKFQNIKTFIINSIKKKSNRISIKFHLFCLRFLGFFF